MRSVGKSLHLALVLALFLPVASKSHEIIKNLDGHAELAQALVTIPIDHVSRHVIVNLRVNGFGPFPFVLDTGASGHGSIDPKVAKRLSLIPVDEVSVDDGSGINTSKANRVKVEELILAGVTFRDVTLVVGEFSSNADHAEAVHAEAPCGILGLELFRDLMLTIDYPGNHIELSRDELGPTGPHVLSFKSPDGLAYVNLEVENETLSACIDTGSQADCVFPMTFIDRLSPVFEPVIASKGRTTNNRYDILSTVLEHPLRLAGHELPRPSADFVDFYPQGILGYGVLSEFRITFDQINRRVQFERNDDFSHAGTQDRLGIRARPWYGLPKVIQVRKGSPAARSGLRVGDVLLQVGEARITDLLSDGAVDNALASDQMVDMVIRRGGRRITLKLQK